MHKNRANYRHSHTAVIVLVTLMFFACPGQGGADESEFRDDHANRPHKLYSTHTPGVLVPGRFQAGPCIGAARLAANAGADYQPGLDIDGNAVVLADLPSHDATHWARPSLQFLARRAPTAIENKYALRPRDYVTVDGSDGSIHYNDYPLRNAGDVPPPPVVCD